MTEFYHQMEGGSGILISMILWVEPDLVG